MKSSGDKCRNADRSVSMRPRVPLLRSLSGQAQGMMIVVQVLGQYIMLNVKL